MEARSYSARTSELPHNDTKMYLVWELVNICGARPQPALASSREYALVVYGQQLLRALVIDQRGEVVECALQLAWLYSRKSCQVRTAARRAISSALQALPS
jgi:hypothetical protein